MYLRLYVEATLKYPNSEYHTLLVMPDEGKEAKVVNSILREENDLWLNSERIFAKEYGSIEESLTDRLGKDVSLIGCEKSS